MINKIKSFYSLYSNNCSLVVDCRGDSPAILYWGSRLANTTSPDILALLATSQELQASLPQEAPIGLSPQSAAGFSGSPGVQLHRDGFQWAVYTRIESVSLIDNKLTIVSICQGTQTQLIHCLALDHKTDVLAATTEIVNMGESSLWLDRCDAPCLPIPKHYSKILSFQSK